MSPLEPMRTSVPQKIAAGIWDGIMFWIDLIVEHIHFILLVCILAIVVLLTQYMHSLHEALRMQNNVHLQVIEPTLLH